MKGLFAGRATIAIALALAARAGVARAQSTIATPPDSAPASVSCLLLNGDRVSGTFVRASRSTIRLQDAVLGTLRLPRATVAHCETESAEARESIGAVALAPFDAGAAVAITSHVAPGGVHRLALARTRAVSLDKLQHLRPATPLGARALPAYASRVGWKRSVGTSYTLARGNANTSDLGLTGGVTRRAERSQLALGVHRRFTSANGHQSADYFSATLRYDLATGPNDASASHRPSFFSETVYEHDPFAQVIRRTVSNIGFSVPLSSDSTNDLALEIGGGVTHEHPGGGAAAYTHAGGLLRLAAKQRFGVAHSDQQFAAFPDLSGPVGHYRFNTDFNIAAPITHSLSLKLGVQNRYDTHPQNDVRNSDTTVQSGFAVEF